MNGCNRCGIEPRIGVIQESERYIQWNHIDPADCITALRARIASLESDKAALEEVLKKANNIIRDIRDNGYTEWRLTEWVVDPAVAAALKGETK